MMAREITSHKFNVLNEAIKIEAHGSPGPGGANTHYTLGIPGESQTILFHSGPISKHEDAKGISNEALIAVVIDRLQSFQNGKPGDLKLSANGPFACRENALALTKLEEAMHWLQHRTNERLQRGVEGTHAR